MKNVNIYFEDKEHEALSKAKGDLSWREFVLTLVSPKQGVVGAEGSDDGVGAALIKNIL